MDPVRWSRLLIRLPVLFLLAVTLVSSRTVSATQRPSSEALKEQARELVGSMRKQSQVIVDSIFSFAELGFQEHETAKLVTGILRNEGFDIETGCAGMPTCYVASWGEGKPVIGLMGDIDGLPETSQRPGVAYHDPLIEGGPGHGEGHNSAATVDVIAAIAIKEVMRQHGLPGTIRVIPGVAEELVASCTYMVNDGLFEGIDVNDLPPHRQHPRRRLRGGGARAWCRRSSPFTVRPAHGAGSPWAGRSALDAVELMNIGWNFRREHLRLHQRSHYMIPHGGNQPNVVPLEASVWYYFRELDYDRIKELHELGQTMAEAAAMMTGTTVTERVLGAAWPPNDSKPLAELMHANILEVGLPQWSDADQRLARAVQRELGVLGDTDFFDVVADGLPTAITSEEAIAFEQGMGGGSDDIAEVSWNVPTVRLWYPGNIPGAIAHHWSSSISMAMPIAHEGANHAAQVIALMAIDLLTDPAKVEEAWTYFREVTTKEYQWESLIPDGTPPPIYMNADKMARYRPQLEALRYDPTRFDTYLQQLGIEYPTVRDSKPED